MRVIATLLLGLLLAACFVAPQERATNMRPALERLISNSGKENQFVVFEHSATGKFVQFDYWNGELTLDLPVIALTKEEQARASTLFASAGVDRPSVINSSNADTGEELELTSYRIGFGKDSVKAAAFGTRVLHEIYLLPPDASFSVEEGWREP